MSRGLGRDDALEAARREPPDMALVDLSLGSDDALQLVTELCARDVRVLVCSTHEEPGYITKREARRELAHTVRDLLEGWMLISPRAAEGLR